MRHIVLLFAFFASASLSAATSVDGDLTAAQQAVDDFEFEAAASRLDALLVRDDLSDSQRAQTALLAGVVARTLGKDEKATAHFTLALDLDDTLAPDPIYGPKITKFFDAIRKKHTPPAKHTPEPTSTVDSTAPAASDDGAKPAPTVDATTAPSRSATESARSDSDTATNDDAGLTTPANAAGAAEPQAPEDDAGIGILPISAGFASAAIGLLAIGAFGGASVAYFVVASADFDPGLRNTARFGWLGGAGVGAIFTLAAFAGVAFTTVLILLEE